jgi:hypothetical protein
MTVQIIPQSGTLFGRVGRALGEGLSEQIPKEMDRYRLAKGLEEFEKTSRGKTPFQQQIDLYKIPGYTAEMGYTMTPLLRQEQMREAGPLKGVEDRERAPGERREDPEIRRGAREERDRRAPSVIARELGERTEPSPRPGLKGKELTEAQLTPLIKKDATQLYNEAAELSRANPVNFPSPADALPVVEQREATRIANIEAEQKVAQTADALSERIRKGLESRWSAENMAKDIPETVQSRFLERIEQSLADPDDRRSEKELVTEFAEQGKHIAQQTTNLDARSKQGWLSGEYTPKKIIGTIRDAQRAYARADAQEEFGDIIANKFNLTSGYSAYLASPPDNKRALEAISSLKLGDDVALVGYEEQQRARSAQAADRLLPLLREGDNLLSYATLLRKYNLDPQIFMDRVRQNWEAGVFTPTDRQEREITKGIPAFRSLGDIYLFSLMNEDNLVEE